MTIELANDNLNSWNLTLPGPAGTPFAGGIFSLVLTLPPEYPFKPPEVNFRTKIWHPNVTNDGKGVFCMGVLRPDTWKPSSKLRDVLELVVKLVIEPDANDPVEADIAKEYLNDHRKWERKAREWTAMYAVERAKEKGDN
jgi:ubiquitin-protein ligase